jgi:hypothetical protein
LLGVVVLAFVCVGLATSSSARAYVGESAVETKPGGGVGDELTGPAKSILENPTFLPETVNDAVSSVGADEGGAVAGTFEGAGFMPLLGSVLAFGTGAGIGSLICHEFLSLEGCWGYSQTTANPSPGVSGSWRFTQELLTDSEPFTPVPAFTWVWSAGENAIWSGWGGADKSCGLTPPGGGALHARLFSTDCKGNHVEAGAMVRSPLANTKLQGLTKAEAAATGYSTFGGTKYCPTATPTTCLTKPPANWPERVARGLHSGEAGIEGKTRGKIGESIAAAIEPKIHYPYKTYITIPSCDELKWGACSGLLTEKGLSPSREQVNWEKADLTKPADMELELKPGKGSEVVKGSKVIVVTNPEESGMPVLIPEPEPGETYEHYVKRLATQLEPHRVNVGEAELNPAFGPNAVLRVQPEPHTRVNPEGKQEVEVQTNPPTAPVPPGGGWTPPGIAPISMAPLSGLSPCGVFPFGLFCWVGGALAQFNTTAKCPSAGVPVKGFGESTSFQLSLCGEASETIMGYVRPLLLIVFIVGCGFMFARGTTAIGAD